MSRALVVALSLSACSPTAPSAPVPAVPSDQSLYDAPSSMPILTTTPVGTKPIDTKPIDAAIASAQRARDIAERRASILDSRAARELR